MLKTLSAFIFLFTASVSAQSNVIVISAPVTSTPQFSIEVSSSTQNIWEGYPTLKRICSCESWGSPDQEPRQTRDGKILWSDFGTPDVGGCQINLTAHKDKLNKLGLDVVNSFEDNVKYAKLLYDKNGTKDWLASKSCWNTK